MSSAMEEMDTFIYEKDYFRQLGTVHNTSVLFYRRSDEIKGILNTCIPELHSVRSASEIRQVTRLLTKSAAPSSGAISHPKFSMIVAEVDHTIIKFMEALHKYYDHEKKKTAKLPLLLLMSPTVEKELKMYVQTCEDVYYVLQAPFTAKDVFESMVVMLHRRRVANDLFTKLTVAHTKHISETKCALMDSSTSTVLMVQEVSSSLAEEIDEEDLVQDELHSNKKLTIEQYIDSSRQLLPRDAVKMREYYIREVYKSNVHDVLKDYRIDAHERGRIDAAIVMNLHKGIAHSVHRSTEVYETLPLVARAESRLDEVSRTTTHANAVEIDPLLRADTCNIMDQTCRPSYDVNDVSQANLFGSDILPFVDRVRPDMSRPRTVAGMYQNNASACWTVMKSKSKLINEVEHKHARPWATSQTKTKKVSKPAADSQGTMTLETFMKIKDLITKHDSTKMKNMVMEEAIPIPTPWECPKITKKFKTSVQKKAEFQQEVEKTKAVLKSRPIKTPPINRPGTAPQRTKILSMKSLPPDEIPERPMTESSRQNAIGTMQEWRGVSESTPRKPGYGESTTSTRKLSSMLRSTGGLNFGSLIVNHKARDKAKRMVNTMAVTAAQDMQTSRMIWINLDNRRVSAFDRDNLSIGINHLQNDKLEKAFKCFSKGIMVCKQVHIAMIFRGIVQYRRGKFFEALDDFTNASKNIESSNILIKNHMEDIVIARFNRGITHIRLGDDAPGLADLEFALAINPANVHVRNMLMQVQRRSSNYIEAVEHCLFIKNVAEEEAAVLNEGKKETNSVDGESSDDFNNKQSSFLSSPKSRESKGQPPKALKRGVSHFESMVDYAMSSEVYKPKTVDVDIKNPESSFPGLKERKANYMQQKNQEFSSQNSMFLENFKHAHGYKRHMFDTHFIRLTDVQEALIQTQHLRTLANKALIMRVLRSYTIFSDIDDTLLMELAGCVEYRAISSQSVVFFQDDPVEAVVLVLSGQLQLRLEGKGGEIPTSVVAELNQNDMYGHFGCIFHSGNTGFLQQVQRICQDAESGIRSDFSPQQLSEQSFPLNATQSFNEHDLPRALQPGGFMTCKVSSPAELILVHKADFDRLVRKATEIQFFKRLELLKASGVFNGDFSYYDLVRLGRMCVLRRYRQGEVILSQGEAPEFVYFVLKGICKAMKRPDPTEYLAQRLVTLKNNVNKFDELYTYHHSLRHVSITGDPAADAAERGSHQMEVENEHKNMKAEIANLEVQHAKEIILEKARRQEEKELSLLGHDVPDRFVDVSSLHWPQMFGEAAILQPESGVSAGTVVADTNCHLLCMHKYHLRLFNINKCIIDNVKDRMVVYPSHEKLVMQLADKESWVAYKAETLDDLSKERWPGCQAAKPQNFCV